MDGYSEQFIHPVICVLTKNDETTQKYLTHFHKENYPHCNYSNLQVLTLASQLICDICTKSDPVWKVMSLNIPNGEHWTAMAVHSHFSKKSEPSKKFHQFSSSNHIRIDRTRTPHSQRAKGVEGRFDRSVLYSAQNMRERGTKRNITGSKHTEKISLMLLPTTKENVMSLFIDRLLSYKSRAC